MGRFGSGAHSSVSVSSDWLWSEEKTAYCSVNNISEISSFLGLCALKIVFFFRGEVPRLIHFKVLIQDFWSEDQTEIQIWPLSSTFNSSEVWNFILWPRRFSKGSSLFESPCHHGHPCGRRHCCHCGQRQAPTPALTVHTQVPPTHHPKASSVTANCRVLCIDHVMQELPRRWCSGLGNKQVGWGVPGGSVDSLLVLFGYYFPE